MLQPERNVLERWDYIHQKRIEQKIPKNLLVFPYEQVLLQKRPSEVAFENEKNEKILNLTTISS